MPARKTPATNTLPAALVAAAAAILLACSPAQNALADDAPDAREAIERARALELEGHLDDAYVYLTGLVEEDEGLSRDATVLLELARLTPSTEESVELLEAAAGLARDGDVAAAANELLGDYLYARGSYMPAALQYESAADRASSDVQGRMLLKRAASLLAAGDAMSAAEAYRDVAERGDVPDESRPWALLGLGRALVAKGDYEEAASEFEELARVYPDHDVRPMALAGAGEAYAAAGSTAEARAALETLSDEYGGTYSAILAREDLRSLPPDTTSSGSAEPPAEPEVETRQ